MLSGKRRVLLEAEKIHWSLKTLIFSKFRAYHSINFYNIRPNCRAQDYWKWNGIIFRKFFNYKFKIAKFLWMTSDY